MERCFLDRYDIILNSSYFSKSTIILLWASLLAYRLVLIFSISVFGAFIGSEHFILKLPEGWVVSLSIWLYRRLRIRHLFPSISVQCHSLRFSAILRFVALDTYLFIECFTWVLKSFSNIIFLLQVSVIELLSYYLCLIFLIEKAGDIALFSEIFMGYFYFDIFSIFRLRAYTRTSRQSTTRSMFIVYLFLWRFPTSHRSFDIYFHELFFWYIAFSCFLYFLHLH